MRAAVTHTRIDRTHIHTSMRARTHTHTHMRTRMLFMQHNPLLLQSAGTSRAQAALRPPAAAQPCCPGCASKRHTKVTRWDLLPAQLTPRTVGDLPTVARVLCPLGLTAVSIVATRPCCQVHNPRLCPLAWDIILAAGLMLCSSGSSVIHASLTIGPVPGRAELPGPAAQGAQVTAEDSSQHSN